MKKLIAAITIAATLMIVGNNVLSAGKNIIEARNAAQAATMSQIFEN